MAEGDEGATEPLTTAAAVFMRGGEISDADSLDRELALIADKAAGTLVRDWPEGPIAALRHLLLVTAALRAVLGVRPTPTLLEVRDRWLRPAGEAARAAYAAALEAGASEADARLAAERASLAVRQPAWLENLVYDEAIGDPQTAEQREAGRG